MNSSGRLLRELPYDEHLFLYALELRRAKADTIVKASKS
jgi:hypothetical protein